jgi:hypothetical protein
MPVGWPEAQVLPPFEPLLAVLCVCESGCTMRLESLGCARKLAFHIAFGALNIVSEDVKSCPIALRLNSHCISPFVESQGNACAVRARRAHEAVLVGWRATASFFGSWIRGKAHQQAWFCTSRRLTFDMRGD